MRKDGKEKQGRGEGKEKWKDETKREFKTGRLKIYKRVRKMERKKKTEDRRLDKGYTAPTLILETRVRIFA